MEFWISCERREYSNDEYTGYSILVDWDTKKILKRLDVPKYFDKELSVGQTGRCCRGVRSVIKVNDEMFVLVQGGILVYDPNTLKIKRHLRNSILGVGGHYLVPDGDGIWTNSCALDLLVKVDYDGNIIDHIQVPNLTPVVNKLGLKQHEWDIETTQIWKRDEQTWIGPKKSAGFLDQLHLNTIQLINNKLFTFSCTKKALIELYPNPSVAHVFGLSYPHDCIQHNDRIYVNESGRGRFHVFNKQFKPIFSINIPNPKPGFAVPGSKFQSGWTRGLEIIDDDRILIGTSPFAVYEIDVNKRKITNEMIFSNDHQDACHGIRKWK